MLLEFQQKKIVNRKRDYKKVISFSFSTIISKFWCDFYKNIKDKYEITIKDEQIEISTFDSTKGIMQVDLSNNESQYEVFYRYSEFVCIFITSVYGIFGGIIGFLISLVVGFITFSILDRIIIRVKD